MDTKFPLLLSSGSRQDYTRGTDEGLLGLRTPHDVDFFSRNLVGGTIGSRRGGWDSADDDGIDDDDVDAVAGTKTKRRHGGRRVVAIATASAAERVLARARDRALGVAFVASYPRGRDNKRSRKIGGGSRSYVVGTTTNEGSGMAHVDAGYDDVDDDDEDGDIIPRAMGAFSLIDWLSSSRGGEAGVETKDDTVAIFASDNLPPRIPLETMIGDDDIAAGRPSSPSIDRRMQTTCVTGDGSGFKVNRSEDHDEEDDLEDGFIAM
jgi:hypothetical protein